MGRQVWSRGSRDGCIRASMCSEGSPVMRVRTWITGAANGPSIGEEAEKTSAGISPGWGSMGVSKGLHRTEQDRRCKEHGRRQAGQGAWKTKVRTIGWREAADRYVPSRGWQAMYLPKARYKYFPRPGRGVRWEKTYEMPYLR
ncbi:uncharacterized protein GLRG_03544 [Colletotrichum graminicola M1.001]|uniref:Uncharacterized protein n=1 Tax=Colletotrichum graminicola (strain M1.001 / M2 / FGSC 10212) TaxID=645133 RepID=E3QBR1_COLGM|nr:uncharacterized protein GLRG_03544 [Colletotrichum graminicola M1.001]EFQ28400.1 hypothetical protein GLRG_03544 [Colletotrichum graminicola M1.001]